GPPRGAEAVAGALLERLDSPAGDADDAAPQGRGAPGDAEQGGARGGRERLDAALVGQPDRDAFGGGEVAVEEAAEVAPVGGHEPDAAAEVGGLDGLGHRLLDGVGGGVGEFEVERGHGGTFSVGPFTVQLSMFCRASWRLLKVKLRVEREAPQFLRIA